MVVESADVFLLQPVLGGGGRAYTLYNAVGIEAVLANPVPSLPEIARLGWLWTQLNLDLPTFQDQVGRDRLREIGPLATLPPLLAAAEEVELVRFNRETLAAALAAWHCAGGRRRRTAQLVGNVSSFGTDVDGGAGGVGSDVALALVASDKAAPLAGDGEPL